MDKRKLILILIVSTLAAVSARMGGWWTFGEKKQAIALAPDDPEMVSLGKSVYAKQCASCHGAKLQGQANWQTPLDNGRFPAPPHNQDGHTWHHSDELLFQLTKFGPAAVIGNGHQSDMPEFASRLSDREILAALSYIKSTWPPELRQEHDLLNTSSRTAQEKR